MRIVYCNCHGVPKHECPKAHAEPARTTAFPMPSIQTDSFRGTPTLYDQFKGDEWRLKLLRQKAERMGISISGNESYQTGLAAEAMDPRALVPPGEGKEYMRRILRKRNHTCEELGVEATDRDPAPTPKLAADLVEEHRRNMVKKNPGLKAKKPQELRELIIDKHGSKL